MWAKLVLLFHVIAWVCIHRCAIIMVLQALKPFSILFFRYLAGLYSVRIQQEYAILNISSLLHFMINTCII